MRELCYTLPSDGSSDRALLKVLPWLLREHGVVCPVQAAWADLRLLLADDFARTGFEVTGIDPAPESIETARAHASASGLSIDYRTGFGEQLPFPDSAFDHLACCDVLEQVDDVDRVIGEIARVLRPGGLFF